MSALLSATALGACGGEAPSEVQESVGGITVGESDTDVETTASDTESDDDDSGDDDTDGGGAGCQTNLDCSDGVCIDGVCCDEAFACGESCCGDGELCLFDACVAPGAACTTAHDCEDGEYCELAFGEPGGGLGDPAQPGLVCTQELPASGACLALPQRCDEPGADPATCVEACEFEPQPGQLNTAVKWQWGLVDAGEFPEHSDVWATPTVARLYDANCDGRVDANDPPNLVFVAGDTNETCCSCGDEPISSCKTGVLRMLDGSTGEEIWSLDKATADGIGFAGLSVALGDLDRDGYVDIVAMTGDGYPVVVDRNGQVLSVADAPVPNTSGSFGWGGGLALGDMNEDGSIEIAYGVSLYGMQGGAVTKLWDGAGGSGGGPTQALSYMVDLDGDGAQELLAGNTLYEYDGTIAWQRTDLPDGFTAVGDLDEDGSPEVTLVSTSLWVLDGATGADEFPPVAIPGDYIGGPPTVADFDGDTRPEVGVAGGQAYVVYRPDYAAGNLSVFWQHQTKDTSSARTGSSVFDFEGDGRAEVVYSDECFLRVLDGVTGELRYAAPNTTFTATEALIVADVDGDGHAEIVRVSNSANWQCDQAPWTTADPESGRPAWEPPPGQNYYQGITVFGDAQNSWVGTRTLWNQHAYSVSNVCDGEDGACDGSEPYGAIPQAPKNNWSLPWLNNFRQNVQESGIFDAPDATVDLDVLCTAPVIAEVAVRNAGFAPLPAGVEVEVRRASGGGALGSVVTTEALLPGQTQILEVEVGDELADASDGFVARIVDVGPAAAIECRPENNESAEATTNCVAG